MVTPMTSTQTTTAKSFAPAALVFDTDRPQKTSTVLQDSTAARMGFRGAEGMIVLEDALGCFTFARLTGRTRTFWGMACPTFDRFEVETIADSEGVIWGVPGERLQGTFATRPENLRA